MNFIEAAIFIIFFAIISVPLANRLRLPLEIFLVIGSCVLSLLPALPSFHINPMIVFDIFLPPILFAAAYFISWRDFKFNIRPITLLAIGLVLFTTVVIAVVARMILPGFSWAEGFLLGAILSPTDASAATSIIKKLGVSRRFTTILEAESLMNDASALLLYRFSLGAIIYGTFSLPRAIGDFFIISIGGAVVGYLVAFAALYIERRLKDVSAETVFTFITAFTSFLLAERLGLSGIIATVVSGIYFGLHFPEAAPYQTRIHVKVSWNTLLFIVNGFVFTLIGFQLPAVMASLGAYPLINLVEYGLIFSLCVILLRLAWVYPAALIPRFLFPSIAKKDPMPNRGFLFAIGWSGLRGIISLAAVLAIPLQLPSGVEFPHRHLLFFITYFVVVVTLVLPSLTLRPLLRWLNLTHTEDKTKEEALARIRAMEGIIERVTELTKKEKIPSDILENFKKQIDRRLNMIRTQMDITPFSTLSNEYLAIKKLTIITLECERETLIQLRREGEIHDEVFHTLMDELDIEEMRARTLRI